MAALTQELAALSDTNPQIQRRSAQAVGIKLSELAYVESDGNEGLWAGAKINSETVERFKVGSGEALADYLQAVRSSVASTQRDGVAGPWWQGDPQEKYWMEITNREDVGGNLRAPQTDNRGRENWSYRLVSEVSDGDVVLHWWKGGSEPSLVGWSIGSGQPFETTMSWSARGTAGRSRPPSTSAEPAWEMALNGFTAIDPPITLAEIRAAEPAMRKVKETLEERFGEPLYFPFAFSDTRPVRGAQGYMTKFPAALVTAIPRLGDALSAQSSGRGAWLVRAWDGQENHASDFESLSKILIGFRMGDLTGMDRSAIRQAVDAIHADRPAQARMNIAGQLNLFVNEIQPADIVLTPASRDEGEVLVGIVSGPYEYLDPAPVGDWRQSRPVGWQRAVMRSELDDSITRSMQTPQTIVRLADVEAAEQLLSGAPMIPPMHLMLKWRAEDEPRTIELHREVANRSGSVWWGKLGDPDAPRKAMSDRMLARFREQLENGVPTHVYLYRPGEVWRTNLLDITLDAATIDRALVPPYYGDVRHNLWVRLANFEPLGPAWALTNLEPAGPRSSEAGMETFLRSRSSVLYVHERQAPPPGGTDDEVTEEPRTREDLTVDLVRTFAEGEGLILDDSVLLSVVAAIHAGKHIVLTGPPGTAKTTLAQAIADAATGLGLSRGSLLTTATADWTTYETIGGLRPTTDGRLEFAPGHFLDAIETQQWLVIDELNRSNFDRAFGQLFTVLSGQTVVLPYEDPRSRRRIALVPEGEEPPPDTEPIDIPRSWQVIATMNVFDKSLLFEMSFALMRRFAFIEVPSPTDEVFLALIERESGGSIIAQDVARSLLPLRAIKEMGPALYMDVARFASMHAAIADTDPGDLAFQAFYSYLLPQFEGIDETQGNALFNGLRDVVGARNSVSLKRVLRQVLGLELADVRQRPGQASEDESEEEDVPIEFETPETGEPDFG